MYDRAQIKSRIGFPTEELTRRKSQIILTPGYIILAVELSRNTFGKIVSHLSHEDPKNLPGFGTIHILRQHNFELFLTHPLQKTVLNVRKTGHFLDPFTLVLLLT
jgi:hypothetical protein